VSARAVVEAACADAVLPPSAGVALLAVGKAASAMARAFVDARGIPSRGLVIGTHGGAPAPLVWRESAHPVPDARSEQAARDALALAGSVDPAGWFVVLVSGGASSLMALGAPGVPLADKQAVTRHLLAAGADISALNCVRKHLSAVKGGRLARASRGRVLGWLLSDVVGDDPSVIGSGPTVPDPTTYAEALAVLDRFGDRGAYPGAAREHLEAGAAGRRDETPKTAADLQHATTRVIGSAARAVEGAAAEARARGYDVLVRPDPITGEARRAAAAHVAWVRQAVGTPGRRVCVLSSGETTVRVTGAGRGGRNQEFALAAALASLPDGWRLASLGTDGVDGPTDAAGAEVDAAMLARARARGLDPMAYLHANDSWTFFAAAGGHLTTGPTDTNVGDVQIVLVPPAM
jgi:hydroxypyruvate reductase